MSLETAGRSGVQELERTREPSRGTRPSRLANWLRDVLAQLIPAVIGLTIALAAWQAWVEIKDVKPYLVPAPSRVA